MLLVENFLHGQQFDNPPPVDHLQFTVLSLWNEGGALVTNPAPLSASLVDSWVDGHKTMILRDASRVDAALTTLLRMYLVPDGEDAESIFGRGRELESFGSKIKSARVFGLLDREFTDALDQVRRLRNDLAHATDRIDLDVPPHRNRIDALVDKIRLMPFVARTLDERIAARGNRRWFSLIIVLRVLDGRLRTARSQITVAQAKRIHLTT